MWYLNQPDVEFSFRFRKRLLAANFSWYNFTVVVMHRNLTHTSEFNIQEVKMKTVSVAVHSSAGTL